MGEKWHYATYNQDTGDLIQESTVEFRSQAPETLDDLRDRVLADGVGFLALDPDQTPLDDISRWSVQNDTLVEKHVDPMTAWNERLAVAQAAVLAIQEERPNG